MERTITVDNVIDFLNELLKTDPAAIDKLFTYRTKCNQALADHETVQVVIDTNDKFLIGFIGILNGLFGKDENNCGYICMNVVKGEDGKDQITHFCRFGQTKEKTSDE